MKTYPRNEGPSRPKVPCRGGHGKVRGLVAVAGLGVLVDPRTVHRTSLMVVDMQGHDDKEAISQAHLRWQPQPTVKSTTEAGGTGTTTTV
jgi:hypothetical protein